MWLETSKHWENYEEGFATLEILIALALITLAISAITITYFGTQSLALDNQMEQEAIQKAKSILEEARASSFSNWDSVVTSEQDENPFTEDLEIGDADEFLKSAMSKITWQSQGKPEFVELDTLLFDRDDALASGSCADTAEGDWANPQSADIALATTGKATGVDVKNSIAYVTADGNSTQPDFFAIDVSSSTASVLWSLNTGPGLLGIKVSGNYAYVANSSINSQLQIINLATHAITNYKLPSSSTGDTANTLYYFSHKVYIGIPKSTIEEFHIIDVSDLGNVNEVGKLELNVGVNGIYVSNGVAYVATPDNQELKMLDVHEPGNISFIDGYDAPGGSGNGKSFARKGKRLFLGRTVGNQELYVLDIDDVVSGAKANANINSSVNGLATIGDLVYLATTDGTKEFQVWQISDDDSAFTFKSSLNLNAKATAVDCEGQKVYVTSEDPAHGLTIITTN